MSDEIHNLAEWLDKNFGERGIGGFCDGCGEDWKSLPFGWTLKDIRDVGDESKNTRYWFCSKECDERITKEIENGTRYQNCRIDSRSQSQDHQAAKSKV